MWKKLVTTARFAICQHFTKCSQQSYTTDFTTDSTKRNQKTRDDLDVLAKRWTILQHTDCSEQKCQEWSIKMCVATIYFINAFDSISHQSLWNALEKCGIESTYISLLRRLYEEQQGIVSTDRESDMRWARQFEVFRTVVVVVVVVSDIAFTCVAMDTSRADGSHQNPPGQNINRPQHWEHINSMRMLLSLRKVRHLLHIHWAHTSSGPKQRHQKYIMRKTGRKGTLIQKVKNDRW